MRRSAALAAILLVAVAASLQAHDLFLKLTSYFVAPGARVAIPVLNGTFSTSENSITRDRVRDISLVGGGKRTTIDTTAWTAAKDNKSSVLTLTLPSAGTWVVAASTRPRELKLDGKAFNAYLKDEGLGDMLALRTREKTLGDSTNERYHKHVKAIVQVGDARSNDFAAVLGYPAEIVPTENPYSKKPGDKLTVRCLLNGRPAPGVVVLAGGRTASGARIAAQTVRANAQGEATIALTSAGLWYAKFISMEKRNAEGLTHESTWATLTWGVR